MRISKRFKLGVSQFQLDFVDIDPTRDTPLFVDPHFLGQRVDRWSLDASSSIRGFFQHFIQLLQDGKRSDARDLFSHLGEPNDTCFGMSRGRPNGNAIGSELADDIFESLASSTAAKTGLLADIEDTRIFVHGIDKDRVSDMATALIRGHLLKYTVEQCILWGVPLQPGIPSGDVWDDATKEWTAYLTERLVIAGRPILLVPKSIASYAKRYTPQRYHQHFVLTHLKHEHLRLNSILVRERTLKSGAKRRWVTKKSVKEYEAPFDKNYLAVFTKKHPSVFENFKAETSQTSQSVPDEELTNETLADVVAHLKASLDGMAPGHADAPAYHRLVTGILELCFYPSLISPKLETPLHDGRKRIDITFDNAADSGFFHRLHAIHGLPCSYIMIECKNYSRDVNNPELDQLAGRFGVNRGRFGLLVSRTVEDINMLILRCADAFKDGRGLLIPLSDVDLHAMLDLRLKGSLAPYEDILSDRMRRIALL